MPRSSSAQHGVPPLPYFTDVLRKLREHVPVNDLLPDHRRDQYGATSFVQSDDRKIDDAKSLRDRAEKALGNKLGTDRTVELACQTWFDVREVGQLFALKAAEDDEGESGNDAAVGRATVASVDRIP